MRLLSPPLETSPPCGDKTVIMIRRTAQALNSPHCGDKTYGPPLEDRWYPSSPHCGDNADALGERIRKIFPSPHRGDKSLLIMARRQSVAISPLCGDKTKKGIFIATAGFTMPARELARTHKIQLLTGEETITTILSLSQEGQNNIAADIFQGITPPRPVQIVKPKWFSEHPEPSSGVAGTTPAASQFSSSNQSNPFPLISPKNPA